MLKPYEEILRYEQIEEIAKVEGGGGFGDQENPVDRRRTSGKKKFAAITRGGRLDDDFANIRKSLEAAVLAKPASGQYGNNRPTCLIGG